jgi:hypothetical protein
LSTIAEVNIEWALRELEKFQHMLDYRDRPGMYAATYVGTDDEIAAQRVVVERIFARAIGPRPVVPMGGNDPLRPDRDWTIRCIETIGVRPRSAKTSAKMRRT